MSHMSAHLAPAALGTRSPKAQHRAASWAASQVGAVTPNDSRSSRAAQEEQILKCYTRRKITQPRLEPAAAVAAPPDSVTSEEPNCEEANCEEPSCEEFNREETNGEEANCEEFNRECETNGEEPKCEPEAICEMPNCEPEASSCEPEANCEVESICEEAIVECLPSCLPSLIVKKQRSSRNRRPLVPPSPLLVPIFSGLPGDEDSSHAAVVSEVEAQAGGAAVVGGRPRRDTKRKHDRNYVRSDSEYFDWKTTYPDVPCPSEYCDVFRPFLGDVETISDHAGNDVVVSDHAPMSLKSQIDTQPTRKARRLLVEEPRLEPSHGDESAMCPHTPEIVQESHGECPVDDGHDPGCTSSCASPEPDSFMKDYTPVTTLNQREIGKKAKKHMRPKVMRPPKVLVAKAPKMKVPKAPKVPKTSSKRKSRQESGSGGEGKSSRAKKGAAAAPAQEKPQSNAASAPPSPLPLVCEAPHPEDLPGSPNICIDLRLSCGRGSETAVVSGDPLSTPRGKTLTVLAPSPSLSDQPPFGCHDDSASGSDVERDPMATTPRRKRSQRTCRALLVDGDDDAVPNNISFYRMTDAQQRQHAWALIQADPRLCEDPMRFVQALISETPQKLMQKWKSRANELVFDIVKHKQPANLRLGGEEPRLAIQLQEPLVEREQSSLAIQQEEPLLLGEESRLAIHESEELRLGIRSQEPLPQLPQLPQEPLPQEPLSLPMRLRSQHALPLQARQGTPEHQQLQLVVYGQKASQASREMVLYQDPRSAKAKYKPKVVLDSTTIHTFDRLRLHGGEAQDADRSDVDWVEARKLWSDQAHRFNSIMREVQGDRTFSKWDGSLLDSVVGVFLTQNVSDFLSSNAFMELRAHFPPQSRSNEEQCSDVSVGGCPAGTSSDTDSGGAAGIKRVVNDELSLSGAAIQASMSEAVQVARDESEQSDSDPYRFLDEEPSVIGALATALQVVHIDSCSAGGAAAPDERNECRTILSSDSTPDEAVKDTGDQKVHIELFCAGVGADGQPGSIAAAPEELGTNLELENFALEEAAEDTGDQTEVHIEVQLCCAGGAAPFDEHIEVQLRCTGRAVPEAGACPEPVNVSLEEKYQAFMSSDGTWTPDARERSLAATLQAVLGKRTTGRGLAAKDAQTHLQPLGMALAKLKVPRSKRRAVAMARFKPKMRSLTGNERGKYELGGHLSLNSGHWAAVRAEALSRMESCERDPSTADSVDWQAVQRADVAEVASVIKERGMHNILGGRIKSLLDRINRDQEGTLDLEWIRKLPQVDAQKFLTSVRGLGLKSVECLRLLSLHHPSFPVDTNVGRIVIRLGWVPLEPLPEETRLHLLELYPLQEQIQKYMWPRLCTLDQETLYEFHYQLITFGKVFCTKSKPNCNACPMRGECKHYESAYCRPRLEGPEYEPLHNNSEIVALQPALQPRQRQSTSLLMLDEQTRSSIPIISSQARSCIPIIEEPNSPEYNPVQDIEDTPFIDEVEIMNCLDVDPDFSPDSSTSIAPYDDDKRVMMLDLNETPTQDMSEELCAARVTKTVIVEEPEAIPQTAVALHLPPSQELVLVPQAFPAPQLKNVQRLRTIHYVYELPDNHPLLAKMDKRLPDDPCFYLLAIWRPDEVPETMPKISDDDARNPFACDHPGEEAAAAAVRGTLLVPCRTAMRGSFPLNGTYFQVNEVFADYASSIVPVDVPRTSLWNLRRRFVYFGTSVTSIFKGMSKEEIQCCFKKGYVCVRAMDHKTRKPKLLAARLHQSGAKIVSASTRGRARPGVRRTTA